MSDKSVKCGCCGYFICANRHQATKSDTCPDVISTPTVEEKQDWCGYCGRTNVEVRQWNQGATSTLLCTKCVEKKEECAKLAQQIIDGTAPPTTPDFGDHVDLAVKLACAMFPDTFRLRGHDGTFRVSHRASYVSRGRVMLYTQRFSGSKALLDRQRGISDAGWDDFAKGTISELKGQVVR